MDYRKDVAALLSYVGVTLSFFWPLVKGLVPLGYDLLAYFYPYKMYVSQILQRGELPLWNSAIFMGAPLLANIQAAILYPPNLLFYWLPIPDALRASILGHIFLGAAFTYIFCRVSLGLGPLGSWVAGAVFAFGGFLGAHVGHLNQLHAAVWLPLLLLTLERGFTRRSPGAASIGAGILALQLLAGHTQQVYYSLWAVGLFALYLAIFKASSPGQRLLPLGLLALMGVAAAGLSAVQLIPTLELASQSYRSGGVPYAEAISYSVPIKQLLDSVLPLYWWAPYVEVIGYTGAVSFVLVPAALAFGRRGGMQWFFLFLAALSLVLSLGDDTPVYRFLFQTVPGFDLFRAPGRWLFLSSFSLAALSGMGADSVQRRMKDDELVKGIARYGLGVFTGLLAVLLLLLWMTMTGLELEMPHPRVLFAWGVFLVAGVSLFLMLKTSPRPSAAAWIIAALVLSELYMAREPLEYTRAVDPSVYLAARPSQALLQSAAPFRALSVASDQFRLEDEEEMRAGLSRDMDRDRAGDYLSYARLREVASPNAAMNAGFLSADGYDGGLLPTRRYARFKDRLLGGGEGKADLTIQAEISRRQPAEIPSSRMLGLLGVKYVLAGGDTSVGDSGWEETASYHGGSLRILSNQAAVPRAFVVHASEVASTEDEALLATFEADLQQKVVLEEGLPYKQPANTGDDRVAIVLDSANVVEIQATLETPGYLVLSDSYYPGWRVRVDGVEGRLLKANYAFRAVQLPAGTHKVTFSYEPAAVVFGGLISGVSLVALLASNGLRRRFASTSTLS